MGMLEVTLLLLLQVDVTECVVGRKCIWFHFGQRCIDRVGDFFCHGLLVPTGPTFMISDIT